MKPKALLIFLLLFSLVLTSCSSPNISSSNDSTPIKRDYWPTEDWKLETPEKHGMDARELEKIVEQIKGEDIHAMIIIKDGYLVSEYYKEGVYSKDTLFPIYSCTKSITSSLIGIALEKGHIQSVHQKITDFFPSLGDQNIEPEKQDITLHHLLSSTSGLNWPEWGEWNYYFEPMLKSNDWIEFILKRPMALKPGESFNYNSGGSHLLSAIIQKTTGMDTQSFAEENLFHSIGISKIEWPTDPSGIHTGGHGMRMTARDMAKFGYLYLNNGCWDGQQIIPFQWVEASTIKQSQGDPRFGTYGYQWWVDPKERGIYFAMGFAGQYIIVYPKQDLVVVFTSYLPNTGAMKPLKYFGQIINHSMVSK